MESSEVRQRKGPTIVTEADDSDRSDAISGGDARQLSPGEIQMKAVWAILGRLFFYVSIIIPTMLLGLIIVATQPAVDPIPYRIQEPPALEGALKENDYLTKAEKLYENKISGPESIVFKDGFVYTGTWDGKVLRISQKDGEMEVLARLGEFPEKDPCGLYHTEPICGRPLGMKFDNTGYLIVVDTYLGVYRIDVSSKKVFQYFPASMLIEDGPPRFLNDVAIASDGMIYITDSSQFQRREFIYDILEGTNTGRLIKYNPVANQTEVVVSNLGFANGLQLSKDEDYLLISETTALRIGKLHLTGPKQGTWEEFIDNLPGLPDNIRPSSSGGYWIAMGSCRYQGKFDIMGFLSERLTLRSYISKLPIWIVNMMAKPCSILLEVNKNGKIVKSLMDLSGDVIQFPSEVEDRDGTLYIGSYRSPYIGKISSSIAPAHKQKSKKKQKVEM